MFLSIPMLFARCLPSDFVNPFLPWRIPLAICVALLLAATVALARVFRAGRRTRLEAVVAVVVGAATLVVILAAALLWGASLSFIAWCSPVDRGAMEYQTQLAQASPIITYSVIGVTAVLLALLLATLSVRRFSPRGGRYAG